ncbi:MAG: hypothetical protein HWE27_12325 [Gammaproteobacteria bacterium]|nr:hypothetical protein [Gammaproteobacteria bacterium]
MTHKDEKSLVKRYRIRYFNSGGYKSTGYLETAFTIKKEADKKIVLYDHSRKIGDLKAVEQLFLEQLGYQEDIMIFDVQIDSDSF